jgi:hypothetical protein
MAYELSQAQTKQVSFQAVNITSFVFDDERSSAVIGYQLGNIVGGTFVADVENILLLSGVDLGVAMNDVNAAIDAQPTTNFYSAVQQVMYQKIRDKEGLPVGTVI